MREGGEREGEEGEREVSNSSVGIILCRVVAVLLNVKQDKLSDEFEP